MNMTATCECKAGFVARPKRRNETALTCVKPTLAIPSSFYGRRMPESSLPTGREVHVVEIDAPTTPTSEGSSKSSGCSAVTGTSSTRASGATLAGTMLLGLLARRRRRSR
jgi:MYXO-CTERM domain-containing protein